MSFVDCCVRRRYRHCSAKRENHFYQPPESRHKGLSEFGRGKAGYTTKFPRRYRCIEKFIVHEKRKRIVADAFKCFYAGCDRNSLVKSRRFKGLRWIATELESLSPAVALCSYRNRLMITENRRLTVAEEIFAEVVGGALYLYGNSEGRLKKKRIL